MADAQPINAWGKPAAYGALGWEGVADGDLAQLAAGFLEPDSNLDLEFAEPAAPAADASDGSLVLALDEVVGDGNGEVVFYNEAGLSSLTLRTDAAVVARGTATDHAPIDDQDINGFAFISFESGLTLYYPDGLELAVAAPA